MISSKQRFTVLCILDLLINFDITYVESDMMNGICLKLIRLYSAQSFQSCTKREKKRVKQNLLAHVLFCSITQWSLKAAQKATNTLLLNKLTYLQISFLGMANWTVGILVKLLCRIWHKIEFPYVMYKCVWLA